MVRTLSIPSTRCAIRTLARRIICWRGTTTPYGLHFTINHGGIPSIDPDKHKLVIHGLVKRPLEFTPKRCRAIP